MLPCNYDDPGNAFGNALGNAAIAGIRAENAHSEAHASPDGANPPSPAAAGAKQDDQFFRLPNKELVEPDGTVLSPDGKKVVGHLKPISGDAAQPGAFKHGDRTAVADLLSGKSPGTFFDTVGYNPTAFGLNPYAGFDLSTGGYDGALANLSAELGAGRTTYDTVGFDPTAAPDIELGYGIKSGPIDARLAKSLIAVAELNEAEANNLRVELSIRGDYDAKDGVIEIPYREANDPDAIVQTLAHELGHVMWGSVALPSSQVVNAIVASQMTQQQFVNEQLPLQLQNEGVATINNIAVAEQIWGYPLVSPGNWNTIHLHVNGTQAAGATATFATNYGRFLKSPTLGTLNQAASAIGTFYSTNETLGDNPHEFYGQYYTNWDKGIYGEYAADAAKVKAAQLKFQARQSEQQRLMEWHRKLMAEPNPHWGPYKKALNAYKKGNGGRQ